MAKDQAEADEDMSLKQRLVLAGGSTLEGTSEMVGNETLAGAMEEAGGIVLQGCCSNDNHCGSEVEINRS